MATSPDVQQDIATADAPATEFETLSRARKRDVFFGLPESVQRSLVADMTADQFREFVRQLDPDEATDVLGFTDEETRAAVLERLDRDRREKVAYLLEFSPESAAGLMHLDYVTVDVDRDLATVADAVETRSQ